MIKISFLALLIIFGILVSSESVSAQKTITESDITIATDKSSYIFGDMIIVSGVVKTVVQGSILTIRILDPYSNSILTGQANVSQDGHYTYTVEITGSTWKTGGTYTVLVQYGPVQDQTTFSYTATTAPINDVFQVQIPNNQEIFVVPYEISGGSVTNMAITPSNLSLTILIQSNNYGSITLSLPRSLLDAKTSDGSDGPFTILVDGTEIKPQKEQISSSDRTLTIQFLQGDQDIQIIGTSLGSQINSTISANLTSSHQSSELINTSKTVQTVPEFPFATIPFMVALIAIVLASSRIQTKI